MEKKKKIIIIAAAAAVIAAIAVAAAINGGKKGNETQQTKTLDSAKNDTQDENDGQSGDKTADNQESKDEKSASQDGLSKTDSQKAENGKDKNTDEKKSEEKTSDNNMTKEEKEELAEYTKNLPTFMYFMSSKDKSYADEKATVEKLKSEYDGRVTFMVKEVDGSEDTYKELLGGLETPALVMLDKDGNSTAILPSATDYNTLKTEIEKTLK